METSFGFNTDYLTGSASYFHIQYPAGAPPFLGSEVAYISPSITSIPCTTA